MLKNKVILITGASGEVAQGGFISYLSTYYDLILTDYKPPERKSKHTFLSCDITHYEEIKKVLNGVDAVIHLAGKGEPETPYEIFSVNVMGTLNLIEASIECNIKKFIYFSSVCVYGLPGSGVYPDYLPIDEEHPLKAKDPYGISKILAETLLKSYSRKCQFPVIVFRPGAIIVDTPRNYEYRLSLIKNDKSYREGSEYWNFIDVKDAGNAVRLAIQSDIKGFDVFNLTSENHLMAEGKNNLYLLNKYFPSLKNIPMRKKKSFLKSKKNFFDTSKFQTLFCMTS